MVHGAGSSSLGTFYHRCRSLCLFHHTRLVWKLQIPEARREAVTSIPSRKGCRARQHESLEQVHVETCLWRCQDISATFSFTDQSSTMMYLGIVTTSYSNSFFTPTILKQQGWTGIRVQVMSIPIFIFATVCAITAAFLTDRLKHHFPSIITG